MLLPSQPIPQEERVVEEVEDSKEGEHGIKRGR